MKKKVFTCVPMSELEDKQLQLETHPKQTTPGNRLNPQIILLYR